MPTGFQGIWLQQQKNYTIYINYLRLPLASPGVMFKWKVNSTFAPNVIECAQNKTQRKLNNPITQYFSRYIKKNPLSLNPTQPSPVHPPPTPSAPLQQKKLLYMSMHAARRDIRMLSSVTSATPSYYYPLPPFNTNTHTHTNTPHFRRTRLCKLHSAR